METPKDYHYDLGHLFQHFCQFMQELPKGEGIEVTEDEVLEAWREANDRVGYSKSFQTNCEN